MGAGMSRLWMGFAGGVRAARLAGRFAARLALAAIVVTYSFEVVSRYLFNAPTWWSAELVSYLLCILVFTMMPYVTATRGQVAVTVALEVLPPRGRQTVERAIWGVGCMVCAAMTVFATDEVARQIARNIQMMAAQPIPKWWVSIWIVPGFGLTALEFLLLASGGPAEPGDRQDAAAAEV